MTSLGPAVKLYNRSFDLNDPVNEHIFLLTVLIVASDFEGHLVIIPITVKLLPFVSFFFVFFFLRRPATPSFRHRSFLPSASPPLPFFLSLLRHPAAGSYSFPPSSATLLPSFVTSVKIEPFGNSQTSCLCRSILHVGILLVDTVLDCSSFEVLIQCNRIESRVITGEALPLQLQLGPDILWFKFLVTMPRSSCISCARTIIIMCLSLLFSG
jgi:hypothetical protein